MFPLPITAWLGIGAGVVILSLGVAVKVQTSRLDAAKAETAAVTAQFDVFKAQVKALGEEAEKQAKLKNELNKANMEKANAKSATALANLNSAYSSLREQAVKRAGESVLPSSPANSTSLSLVTFDRKTLDRGMANADGLLQAGTAKILRRGDAAIVDLNVAKAWAQELKLSYSLTTTK